VGGLQRLTHFYDEDLSHYMWHSAIMGLSALLLAAHWRGPAGAQPGGRAWAAGAGVLHGLTYFIIVVEGGTALLGVPFALGAAAVGIIWGRDRLGQRPLLLFFVVAYIAATVLFAGWAAYWGGLPEFSQVGIIQ
jgi:hypothetical protein